MSLFDIFPKKQAETPASIVTVDDAAGLPVAKMKVKFEPVQSGTGDPSPSNVRPFIGRTGLTVYRTGANMLIPQVRTDASNGVEYSINDDGTIHCQGLATGSSYSLGNPTYANALSVLKAGETYTASISISGTGTINYANFGIRYSDGTLENTTVYVGTPVTFTVRNDLGIPHAFAWVNIANGTNANLDVALQLQKGSPSTTYEPYAGSTYAFDWTSTAGTVYDFSIDPMTGVLTVDKLMFSANTSTMNNSENYPGWKNAGVKANNPKQGTFNDAAVNVGSAYSINTSGANDIVYLPKAMYNDMTQTQWIALAQDVQIVYELDTPLTYQLTTQQVVLIKNAINNVWADAGDILEFEYYTEPDYGKISGAFIDGQSLQDAGWFLKWRKLSAPKPKVDYTSIYGKDGSIDQTEALGDVFYEDRDVNLDMVYNGDNWSEAYSDLLNDVHGQSCMVQFTDDPYWYWSARLVANVFTHKPRSLEMSGLAFPYKLSILEKSYQATVSGATEETASELQLEGSRMRVSPKLVVTGEITIKWGTNTKTLSAGTYYVRGLKVGLDGVTINVWGTGTVTITYREGSL